MLVRLGVMSLLIGFGVLVAVPATDVARRSRAHAIRGHVNRHVYYVSPHGRDANRGTRRAPWRTIRKGVKRLSVGDTLYVRGGTYVENVTGVTIRQGTPTAPITVKAYPGERPVIEGLLWLNRPSYWTFDGINVTWNPANTPDEHMVKLGNGVGWRFTNAELWGAHSYAALYVWGDLAGEPDQWSVDHSCIHDTYPSNDVNQDQLIYVNNGPGAGSGVIERNLLWNATNGEGVKLGGPSTTSGAARNVTVRYNTIYNTVMSVLVSGESDHNRIADNIFQRAGANNALVRSYEISPKNLDNVATDNIGSGAARGLFMVYPPGPFAYVGDGGGNVFPLNPAFDTRATCAGFHPRNPLARSYGRFG